MSWAEVEKSLVFQISSGAACRGGPHCLDSMAAVEKAKARANEIDLPELTGTERQIRWALQIRDKFIADKTVDQKTRVKMLKKTASAVWIDKYRHLTAR